MANITSINLLKMLKATVLPKLAFDLFKEAEEYHLEHQKLSNEILTKLHSVFGEVLTAATELLENCKITEYRTADNSRRVYKVGTNLERYTIYQDINFCQCESFRSQVLEDQSAFTCKHILAFKLNQITKNVNVGIETVTDSQFVEFLNDQLNFD